MQITRLKWGNEDHTTILVETNGTGFHHTSPWPCRTWHGEYIQAAIGAGVRIEAADPPPPPTQDELDGQAARSHKKLAALRGMSVAEVEAWVEANVTNFAQAKDVIRTLAVAVAVLAKRI